mmetsp:Transcript_1707/g.3940  ORF Transcript_1707/g.3940 Transcript_1707/m.3940 type:complete len:256 (+) Transcript_1707:401-1168(+)
MDRGLSRTEVRRGAAERLRGRGGSPVASAQASYHVARDLGSVETTASGLRYEIISPRRSPPIRIRSQQPFEPFFLSRGRVLLPRARRRGGRRAIDARVLDALPIGTGRGGDEAGRRLRPAVEGRVVDGRGAPLRGRERQSRQDVVEATMSRGIAEDVADRECRCVFRGRRRRRGDHEGSPLLAGVRGGHLVVVVGRRRRRPAQSRVSDVGGRGARRAPVGAGDHRGRRLEIAQRREGGGMRAGRRTFSLSGDGVR